MTWAIKGLERTHKACFGLLRRSVILLRACHSESSAAADIPVECIVSTAANR